MSNKPEAPRPLGTAKLRERHRPVDFDINKDISYRPMPHSDTADDLSSRRPVWRLRFDVVSADPVVSFGVDVNDVVVLGRGENIADVIDLSAFNAGQLGVSRRHLMLRPTDTNLYVSDLGSTNGTNSNGISIGINSPYSLTGRDFLELGALQLSVTVVKRPKSNTGELRKKADLTDALLKIGKAITSQLDLEEVLRQVLTMAKSSTGASEATIWLVDEMTSELILEAELGVDDEQIKRERLPLEDTMAGKVVRTGQPIRASRSAQGSQIQITGDYAVEAVIYVPLTLGGITLGVLSVAYREKGKDFTELDERLLAAVSEFAAIAIQNSRLVRATDKFLSFHVERLDAFNQMADAISAPLNPNEFYEVLVDLVREHWPVDEVELWVLDDSEKVLIPFADLASNKDVKVRDLPKIGDGPLGEVAETGEAKIISGIRLLAADDAEEEGEKDDGRPTQRLGKPALLAHVPLHIKGRVVAVITLYIKDGASFKNEDIHRLQAATGMAAVAIQNTLLLTRSEFQRATVNATADLLPHPLLIINNQGELVISNQAAQNMLDDWQERWKARSPHMKDIDHTVALVDLIKELSRSVGRTKEITVNDRIYLTTIEHDTKIGTVILLQDVTRVRMLERTRAEFVGALAHDVRGPLTSIRGFARLLKDDRTTSDESKIFTEEIVQSTERVINMVEQLLDIELLGSSRPERITPCDLEDTVEKAVSDLKGVALEKEIALDKKVSGTPYTLKVSSTSLYRSVLNLIDNAIKYSNKNSTVHIELNFAKDNVAVVVRDEGKGISEEDMPHVFDKYFRAQETNQDVPGTGLGLAMVKATAIRFGGDVTVRNVKEGGAEFTITLPREASH